MILFNKIDIVSLLSYVNKHVKEIFNLIFIIILN